MTFAAPLFLLAAVAAAIPIALHMIHRRRAKEMPFSTLRFLKISVEKTRRRKRVDDLLLMILRAAILLLIAIGLGRPAVTHLGSLWGGARSAVAIVLDNSGSMGLVDQDRIRFDTARAAASQILDQFTDGDQVALLPTCGPAFADAGKLDRTQDAAREALGLCRVSYERADLGAKVEQARRLLADSDAPNRQIFVVTDMQRVSWEERGGGEERGEGREERGKTEQDTGASSPVPRPPPPEATIPIIVVDCNRTPKPNVAVQGLDLEVAAPIAGLPVKTTVTLLNASTVQRRPRVELWIDGAKEAGSPELNALPEERVKYDLQFTFRSGGLHRGEVRLVGEDGSSFDDRRFFAMEVDQDIPVAIARGQRHEIAYLDDAYYLDRALSAGSGHGWAIRTASLTATDLMAEPLDRYKAIFCVNLPALNPEAAERLRAYVAGGGHLVWFCGDNVDPAAYNRMNEQAKGELLPAGLVDVREPRPEDHRDSWHISFLDPTFSAFRQLIEPASLYESVLVYKHVRMAAGDGDAGLRVLARLDDGEPLLVMRNVEQGKTLMFGASAHVNGSNFPLRPIFLPMMARLTFALAEVEQTFHNQIAGQPLRLRLAEQATPVGVELVPPDGETLRLKTEGVEGQVGQTFLYANTHDIGVYVLRLLNTVRPRPAAYSFNFDPDEAEPAVIEQAALQERLGPSPLVFAENPDDLSSTFALLREGRSLWGVFLWLVLIALVFETFISNRLTSHPGTAEPKSQSA